MTVATTSEFQTIFNSGRLTAADVLRLRRALYAKVTIGESDAEWLLKLNSVCRSETPAWRELFLEALTDFFVTQASPPSVVSDVAGRWLLRRLSRADKPASALELDLIAAILQKAMQSPDCLSVFAVEQVRAAVRAGSGPMRASVQDPKPMVCAQDVAFLRQTIFAVRTGGAIAVTRTEADLLFDINDATRHTQNDAGWPSLFARAIGLHVTSPPPPSRASTAATEPTQFDTTPEPELSLQFLAQVTGRLGHALTGGALTSTAAKVAASAQSQLEAEQNAAVQATWLARRLPSAGPLAAADVALLTFLKHELVAAHPALRPFVSRVA